MNVFVAGPRAVSRLNKVVKKRLLNIINQDFTVLVGDASGIDKQIQNLCQTLGYNNVKVFASNGKARNNLGSWPVENVNVAPNVKGFEFYAAKDLEMAKQANYGFMIWNGKSKGTLNNMFNLVKLNKKVLVYMIPDKQFYTIRTLSDIDKLKTKDKRLIESEEVNKSNNIDQLSLFN